MIKTSNTICPCCKQIKPSVEGSILRSLRLKHHLTYRELAFRIQVAPSYLHDIERNRRTAPLKLIAFWRQKGEVS